MMHITDEHLLDLVDGNIDEKHSYELMKHIYTCDTCKEKYDFYLNLNESLSEISLFTPSLNFTKNVVAQWDLLKLQPSNAKTKSKLFYLPFIYLGLICVFLFICAIFALLIPSESANSDHLIRSSYHFFTSKSFLSLLVFLNAMLLLWIINNKILAPIFHSRLQKV